MSGVGDPITSASRRITLPSGPSASFNFFKKSGGVAALGSLIYMKKVCLGTSMKRRFLLFTLVSLDASDGMPFPASFSAITRNS